MVRLLLCAGILWGLVGCSKIRVENPTDEFSKAKRLTRLDNKKLKEVSGGVSSRANPGLLWLHNDSGNSSDLYLVDQDLNILLTCHLNVENRDWEDIAIGPGPEKGKTYIYLGEIGDNKGKFDKKYIYRFEEPVLKESEKKITVASLDTITFTLEDGQKDTEALMLDPVTKDIYIVSKREEPVTLYQLKFPYRTDTIVQAKKLYTLPFTQIVGADLSPDGKKVLMKNYEHVFYWKSEDNISIPELLKQKPFEVPYELEPQGETIMWQADGAGFFTLSEKNVGKETYLYIYSPKAEQ